MPPKHTWLFQPHFRANRYLWHGSSLAIKNLKAAVREIKTISASNPILAAEGAVYLFTRFWPAFQQIDTSSGALGTAVHRTQYDLLPLVISAPADRKTRDKWLSRLWRAVQEDGVEYLATLEDHWGELCASPQVASQWADQFLPEVRAAWSNHNCFSYSRASSACLSSLLAAHRHQELLDLLALNKFTFWHYHKFGVDSLVQQGRLSEALAYAESIRGLNQPDQLIDEACSRIRLGTALAQPCHR